MEASHRIVRFGDNDAIGEQDVLDFWSREGAMPPQVARMRVHDVTHVALDQAGAVAAVASVYLQRAQRLRMDLWHFRTFVGREHRQTELARQLTLATTHHLEERFVTGSDTRAGGVLMEIESEVLKGAMREGVRPLTRFVFIGDDAAGRQLRVRYFPGALVPPPG